MKNLRAYAAMALTALAVAGTAVPAQAASPRKFITQINGKKCVIYVLTNCTQKPGAGEPDAGAPESPDVPDTPETPELPDIPGVPENPVVPDMPGAPDTPDAGVPESPDVPSVPDMPGAPDAPESPDTPDMSGKPEEPVEPNAPGTPEAPEENTTYAARVVRLVNEERAKAGLSALTVDSGLEAAGLVRAKEIVSSFSHTRPDGTSFATAIKEQGVSYRGAGENIAWGQKSPEAVVDAWMNSPGHRANILNEKFTRIGVGHYQNSGGTNYWVQLFAY